MREENIFRQENDSFSLIDFKREERKTESGNRRAQWWRIGILACGA